MKKLSLLALIVLSLTACHRIKEKSKETINDTGKAVGQGASQFFDGVKDGVDKTFQSSMTVSDALKVKGLSTGKFSIDHMSNDSAWQVSVYCIFAKDFDQNVMVKVSDQKGTEYGRSSVKVNGKSGEAKYVDIIFDKRTDIESRSKFTLE